MESKAKLAVLRVLCVLCGSKKGSSRICVHQIRETERPFLSRCVPVLPVSKVSPSLTSMSKGATDEADWADQR
jgi:hypothetical protein